MLFLTSGPLIVSRPKLIPPTQRFWENRYGKESKLGGKTAKRLPASRNIRSEDVLGDAIRKRVRVLIRYKDDHAERLIEPYGVYRSTKDKWLLACTQIDNPGKPLDRWEPRNLEIGLMRSVAQTNDQFAPDRRFDPSDDRYQNGFRYRI